MVVNESIERNVFPFVSYTLFAKIIIQFNVSPLFGSQRKKKEKNFILHVKHDAFGIRMLSNELRTTQSVDKVWNEGTNKCYRVRGNENLLFMNNSFSFSIVAGGGGGGIVVVDVPLIHFDIFFFV